MSVCKATRHEQCKSVVAALIFAKLRAGLGSCTSIAITTTHETHALIPPDDGNILHHLLGSAIQYKHRMRDPTK